jgi:hypothetical protein
MEELLSILVADFQCHVRQQLAMNYKSIVIY